MSYCAIILNLRKYNPYFIYLGELILNLNFRFENKYDFDNTNDYDQLISDLNLKEYFNFNFKSKEDHPL